MCEILLSLVIVGAVETAPGWMAVDHLYQEDITTIYVPTSTYQHCDVYNRIPPNPKNE